MDLTTPQRQAALLGFFGVVGGAAIAEAAFQSVREGGGLLAMKPGPDRADRWDESAGVYAGLLVSLGLTGIAYQELVRAYGVAPVVQGSLAASGLAVVIRSARSR